MKKLLLCAVTLLYVVAGMGRASSVSILSNGDFRAGLSGWEVVRGAGNVPPGVIPDGQANRPALELHGAQVVRSDPIAPLSRLIRLSGWMKWEDVEQGLKNWNQATVNIVYYDNTGKERGHVDVFQATGTGDWKRFDQQIILPESAKTVKVQLMGWRIPRGTIWFSGLELAASSEEGRSAVKNLIANPDFELEAGGQSLNWSFPQGTDWDGFALNPGAEQNVTSHFPEFPEKGKVLFLDGPGTAVSEPVETGSGIYQFSAWLKTERVVPGKKDWCKAMIQMVLFDANGKIVGHKDLAEALGDEPWKLIEREVVIQQATPRVEFWLRLFDTASGKVWVDGLNFYNKEQVQVREIQRDKATVTVDASSVQGPFSYHLDGLNSHYLWEYHFPWKRVISEMAVHRMGVKYIRFQESGGSMVDVQKLPNGGIAYDFSRVGKALREAVDAGLTPLLVLESTPEAISSQPKNQWTNRFPPKDFQEWDRYIFAFISYLRKEFGDEELAKWNFETWNEPEAKRYFQGSPEELQEIHRVTTLASRRAFPQIRIGTPGFASWGGLVKFLDFLDAGMVSKPSFVSWHIYTTGTGIPSLMSLDRSLGKSAEALDSKPWAKDTPRYVTEWNAASGSGNDYIGKAYNAAYALTALRRMKDRGIDRLFVHVDCERESKLRYYGPLGLISQQGLVRPFARAFELLHRMSGDRLKAEAGSDSSVDVIASGNKDRIWVAVWNFEENPEAKYTTQTRVALQGLTPSRSFKVRERMLDERNDPYPLWQKWGSPDLDARRDLWEKLDRATGLDAGMREFTLQSDAGGRAFMDLEIPVFAIHSFEILEETQALDGGLK